jgi:gluconate 5-dehydrogenase
MAFELFELTGRRALITGSSQGIGFALAQGLAEHGAEIVLNGRDTRKLDAAAARLTAAGHKVSVAGFDATHAQAVKEGVEAIERNSGAIDILVNNAGMQFRSPLEDFPVEKWEQLLATNISSAFYVGQAVARYMIQRGRGKIINIASVQTDLARPTIAPYTASKGGIRNLTRAMTAEWAGSGLQINALAPGYVHTEMTQNLVDDHEFNTWILGRTPAHRWGTAADLVGPAVWLASDASAYVNGQVIFVDGGMTVVV